MGNDSPRLGSKVVLSLLAKDLDETLTFYSQLGFQRSGRFPLEGQPVWMEVARDGVVLQFYSEPPVGTPDRPVCSGTFYFFPDDVRVLAEEWRSRVAFAWGPEVMDYGMREFGIKDPNGYYLAFSEPVEPSESDGEED